MSQASLFVPPKRAVVDNWDGLRWYQQEACEAIVSGFEENRSQLAVMATGLGKTQVFSALARMWPGNVLVLANREELVGQAKFRLEQMTGEHVGVEQAAQRADRSDRIVVASFDTIRGQHRLDRFGKTHFSLVIVDEAHISLAPTYQKVLEYFDAKLLGVTATPDRGDEKALGKLYDTVAYCFDILQGIEQGYLVPLRGHQVELGEIQLDGIATVAGDLAKGQLDEVMVRAVEGIVRKTLELEPERHAICFFPGVKSAQYATERFNVLDPGSAGFISADTPPQDRQRIADDFRQGRLKRLCNCMIATTGFDAPCASLIVQARPTKSRALYAQMIGRGTRVLGGLVDGIPGRDGAAARRALVAASGKPDCVIMDFVGNSTKHALMTPEDLLGGDYSEEEVERAKKKAKESPGANPLKLLEDARKELAAVAAAVRAKVQANVRSFNPFSVMNVDLSSTTREDMRWGRQAPSVGQLDALKRMKVPDAMLKNISQREAKKLLTERARRHDAGLATYAQLAQLKRFGFDDSSISFAAAGRALSYVSQVCNWNAKRVDPARLAELARKG